MDLPFTIVATIWVGPLVLLGAFLFRFRKFGTFTAVAIWCYWVAVLIWGIWVYLVWRYGDPLPIIAPGFARGPSGLPHALCVRIEHAPP
jgi:hypothetical protein